MIKTKDVTTLDVKYCIKNCKYPLRIYKDSILKPKRPQ